MKLSLIKNGVGTMKNAVIILIWFGCLGMIEFIASDFGFFSFETAMISIIGILCSLAATAAMLWKRRN